MIYSGYDLPASLKTCDKLSNGWDAMSCTGGVFMENYQSSYGVKSRWLRDKDLIYPCNAVAKRHKYYCYDMVTARILPKVDYNWVKAAKWCRKSEQGWVPICFQSLGRDASGYTRLDPARILNICKVAKEMARECIYSAASDMAYTDVSPRRAKVLCNTAPAATREYCWVGIGGILGSLDAEPEKRKARCDDATQEPDDPPRLLPRRRDHLAGEPARSSRELGLPVGHDAVAAGPAVEVVGTTVTCEQESSPGPPKRSSFPPRPAMRSSPPRPWRMSRRLVPRILSRPRVPRYGSGS